MREPKSITTEPCFTAIYLEVTSSKLLEPKNPCEIANPTHLWLNPDNEECFASDAEIRCGLATVGYVNIADN